MVDYGRLLDRGTDVAAGKPGLAAVPVLTGLLAVGNVERVVSFSGVHAGLKFPFPASILDVWSFVAVPGRGVSGPSAVPMLAIPVFVLVRGTLAAGYLGAIRDGLDGRSEPLFENVQRYALPLVGFELLSTAAALVLFAPAVAFPPLILVALPALIAAGYLFWATPYLVVAAEASLVDALERSYELATDGGAYAGFFVAFLLGGVVLSLVATAVVVNLGLVGVLLGTVLLAPVAVVLNAATMALVVELAGPARRPPDSPGGDRPAPR